MPAAILGDIIYFSIIFGSFFFFWYMVTIFWGSWKQLKWNEWFMSQDYTMVELRVPSEMSRTPKAMEMVLNAMWEPSGGGGWFEDWLGIVTRPIFSLELVSIGGTPHFFVWLTKKDKLRFETNMYGQYPTIQIVEVPDYTLFHDYDPETHKLMGFEYKKIQKNDVIPIKTYRHLEQDKPGAKEEEKYDTISQQLEIISAIGPHENMWTQIVLQPFVEGDPIDTPFKKRLSNAIDKQNPFLLFRNEVGSWQDAGKKVIKEQFTEKGLPEEDAEGNVKRPGLPLSPFDAQIVEVVRENMHRPVYNIGLRQIYFAKNEHFNGANIPNMGSFYKSNAGSAQYNSLVPGTIPSLDKPWQFKRKEVVQEMKNDLYDAYVDRKFFNYEKEYAYGKKAGVKFAASTEEIATLYHLPGAVAQTPTFERIASATGDAPSNLPI